MSGGVTIKVDRLKKAFGEKTVLKEVSLDVPAGSFVSIVGKSGCGKSTLLRLLIGLEHPTSGKIDAGAAEAARLVFQEPRLLPWASVRENVEVGLGGALQGEAATARALEALQLVGLGDRGGDWPAQLSGGQRQRVALARALVSHPRLLALDEPLGALDALTRIEMQSLVEKVWKAEGFTALLVTHDVQEAIVLGDRVLLIEDGGVSLDLTVDLPRPRRRGDPAFAVLEGQVLDKLFGAERPPGAH